MDKKHFLGGLHRVETSILNNIFAGDMFFPSINYKRETRQNSTRFTTRKHLPTHANTHRSVLLQKEAAKRPSASSIQPVPSCRGHFRITSFTEINISGTDHGCFTVFFTRTQHTAQLKAVCCCNLKRHQLLLLWTIKRQKDQKFINAHEFFNLYFPIFSINIQFFSDGTFVKHRGVQLFLRLLIHASRPQAGDK